MVFIQHSRLGMLRIPRCGAVRVAVRLVRPKITVMIRPKFEHFILYSNSYLGVLNNYKIKACFIFYRASGIRILLGRFEQ